MIISHKHKFIFIKTAKTAGTSVEIALSRFCGPDDIITPISAEDEPKRAAAGGRGAQNYLAPLSDYRFGDVLYLLRSARRKKRFYNHISATEVVAAVGEDIWNSYFKFCIERNPWDKIVSAYYWKHSDEPRPTMTEFIESGYPAKMKQRGFGLYTIDGRIAVDHFVRFESLSDDMEVVRQRLTYLNFSISRTLNRRNARPDATTANTSRRPKPLALATSSLRRLPCSATSSIALKRRRSWFSRCSRSSL